MRGTRTLTAAIVLALASTPVAFAQTAPPATVPDEASAQPPLVIDYTLSLGAEHSDNINQSQDDALSQNLLIPQLAFSLDKAGSTFQAHAAGQFEYMDYLENAFVNEFRGSFTGDLNWNIIPQRLAFTVSDSSGVQPVLTRVQFAPDNLQQVNVFTAGPTLQFRMGSALRGQAELRYINTLASKTKYFDSHRSIGHLSIIRDLSPTSNLSFNAEAQRVLPSQTDIATNANAAPSYTNYRAYGNYQSLLRKLRLDLSLGWSDFRFGQGVGGHSGAFGNFALNWQATSRSTLGIGAAHQLGDVASDIATNPANASTTPNSAFTDGTLLPIGSSIVTSQVFSENQVNLAYTYSGTRLTFNVSPYLRRRHYINNPTFDLTYRGARSDVAYLLSPRSTLGFFVEYDHIEYRIVGGHDIYTGFGPSFTQQLTPHWSWRVALNRGERNSTTPDHDFQENQVLLFLYYRR